MKIYLIGICGAGMASLAAMLKKKGHIVSGSDESTYPPMSTFLKEQSIPVNQGFSASQIQQFNPDLVLVGNAISRGNPEVEFVLNEKIEYASMPGTLSQHFIKGKHSCVVSGTHGKTTTTSILAWILECAKEQPGFFIGGIPSNFKKGYQIGTGRHFVIEGDEYDSAFFDKGAKFLHYRPDTLIINNIEYDHADIYSNLEEIMTAFRRLTNLVPGKGHIIANGEDSNVLQILKSSFSNVLTFGLTDASQWVAHDLKYNDDGLSFSIKNNTKSICKIQTSLLGEFNVRNILGAVVAAITLGVSPEIAANAIRSFTGVVKRMNKVAEINNIQIYMDFAHHATAIKETLKGVKLQYPGKRIWAIFEPRSASTKRRIFEEQFYNAFNYADQVIISPLHRPDKVPAGERLSVERIIDVLNQRDIRARTIKEDEKLLRIVSEEAQPEDIIIFMSNGSYNHLPDRLKEALIKKPVI